MSRRLPAVSGGELIRKLERVGFVITRISGSHYVLGHRGHPARRVIVPVHGNKPLKKGTLASILKRAQVTADDLADL